MPGARLTFIPDVLEEHIDELGFLWGQRQSGLRSADYTYPRFLELESRVSAHLRGILVVGERAEPMLDERLEAEDELDVFAAAFGLLHLGGEDRVGRLVEAFAGAAEARLDGLRMALAHGPLNGAVPRLWSLLDSGVTVTAAAAAEALAFHSSLRLTQDQLEGYLGAEEAAVRRAGWRLVAYLRPTLDAKAYAAALRDEDEAVRVAALHAAAWCGVQGIMTLARRAAERPADADPELLYLLAVLAAPEDAPLISAVAENAELGPDRFRYAGAFGHPSLVDRLLEALEDEDPAVTAAAGAAFTRITGVDVETDERAQVRPAEGPEPDEFEEEFLDEVMLPDPALARRRWAELRPALSGSARLCHGVDVSRTLDGETFNGLDMQARWELYLRSRFYGAWDGTPLSLELFPQGR